MKASPHSASSARIGDSVLRVEDERLLRGQAMFIDDIDLGSGTLHVEFVRSRYAHGTIRGVDTAAARDQPGVVAVLTAVDFKGAVTPITADFDRPGFKITHRPAIAEDCVRYVGEVVAMVVARDPYVALDAAELVELDLEQRPSVVSVHDAVVPGAVKVHDYVADNVLFEDRFASPDFASVHAATPHKIKAKFAASRIAALSMEPRGCAARFDRLSGQLELWSSTQIPQMVLSSIAEQLGLRNSDIRVIAPDVGGGFGMKAVIYPEELLMAAVAIQLGRPVKWIQDRYDDLVTSAQARHHCYEAEAGFDDDGGLISLSVDVMVNIGAYPTLPFGASFEANGAPRNIPGAYRLQNFAYRTRAVTTNSCPTGAYRGVSAPLSCFVMEGMLDRIAAHLGIDPADVRRRNLVTAFPYRNVLGLEYTEGCFAPALERALEKSGYAEFRRQQQAADRTGDVVRGIGLAVITEQTGMGAARYKARGLFRVPGFEGASVKVEPDGSVLACISQAAQGQGHATAYSQIVSDLLVVPLEAIKIVEGDTGRVPFGTGTFASRGMVIAGNALRAASVKVRDKMAEIASTLLECAPGDIVFGNGYAHVAGAPALRLSAREIASTAYSTGDRRVPPGTSYGLEALEYYDAPSAEIASGVHVATVSVDRRTGAVTVDSYVVLHDCGQMINPLLVDGQVLGAVVQGLGEVFMEELSSDAEGQPLTVSLMDYQIPRSVDVPPIDMEAISSEDGGRIFKGVGESGIIGAVPVLANAVSDALSGFGVAVSELPLTAKAIRALLRAAQERSGA